MQQEILEIRRKRWAEILRLRDVEQKTFENIAAIMELASRASAFSLYTTALSHIEEIPA